MRVANSFVTQLWLYIDEMDYMSDKDFEAVFAITLEAPDRIGVMAASTPTGARSMFYKICNTPINQDVKRVGDTNFYDIDTYDRHTAEGWQEFHYPTSVNPEWNPKMEAQLKAMYSQIAYEHEVLAEFGTEMVGVFKKELIDEASDISYNYKSSRNNHNPISIGVDWDKF